MDQCFDNIPACREKISRRPVGVRARRSSPTRWCSRRRCSTLCVKVFGADNVLYGSDYPHTIGDMPGCLARVNALPGATRDKVRGRNAQRVFGF